MTIHYSEMSYVSHQNSQNEINTNIERNNNTEQSKNIQ